MKSECANATGVVPIELTITGEWMNLRRDMRSLSQEVSLMLCTAARQLNEFDLLKLIKSITEQVQIND